MFRLVGVASAIAIAAVPMGMASAQSNLSAAQAAKLFGARETVEDIDISPDGTSVVYVSPGTGRTTKVNIASLGDLTQRSILGSNSNPETLRWCNFVGNSRLVCRITAMVDHQGSIIPMGRLYAVDRDGRNGKLLGQTDSYYDARLRQFDGDVLDWLPDGDGRSVLMSREYIPEEGKLNTRIIRTMDGLGVDRVDTISLRSTIVERALKDVVGHITDGRGNVRVMTIMPTHSETGVFLGKTIHKYRTAGSKQWRELSSQNIPAGDGLVPLAVDGSIDSLYALMKHNRRWALFRIKLDGSLASELIFAHDKVDVDNVVRIGRGQRVIGVTFADEMRRTIYFDPEYKALANSLAGAIPNLPLIRFGSSSGDGSKVIVHASSDSDPGRYFVYDKTQRSLNEIILARPELENVALARVKATSYRTPDGATVPAYLTLPPGKENARGLPAVVLPHGGPESRDEWGFDWLAQFLANQGYAVLQPNFRGSSGYGDDWMRENGFRGWRTSIGDVLAGAKWLASEGIADPSRMAIVGWSYGGYAALQSATVDSRLFRAVVAIAPVTDLALLKQNAERFTNARLVADYVGSGPHVREGSPLQNIAAIQSPVLMFHGTRDLNVEVEHSRRMHRALAGAGKKSDYVEYAGLAHSLEDSNARAEMLERIASFLSTNMR